MSDAKCSACEGTEQLRHSPFHGEEPICKPCFMLWYDSPSGVDVTDPASVGAESRRRKANNEWPWK